LLPVSAAPIRNSKLGRLFLEIRRLQISNDLVCDK
jgi:hypothetical protein